MAEIVELSQGELLDQADALAALLCACVDDGASIGFLRPMDMALARNFWASVAQAQARGERRVFAAYDQGTLEGSAQLCPVLIPNQPHRAEIAKLIVHPQARRKGHARALMQMAETQALAAGRRLLTLDTAGEAATQLYRSLGYVHCGGIPGYALDADGRPEPNLFFYKSL
jgi:ribosomal protein S18 acetylase RimI-like enzyme